MTSLTEFLEARLSEDEAVARAAGGEWWYAVPPTRPDEDPEPTIHSNAQLIARVGLNRTEGIADHLLRHDPARVLAQCAALRRIVEACGPVVAYESYEGPDYYGGTEACELTLRALASIYADHPDFDPTWRLT